MSAVSRSDHRKGIKGRATSEELALLLPAQRDCTLKHTNNPLMWGLEPATYSIVMGTLCESIADMNPTRAAELWELAKARCLTSRSLAEDSQHPRHLWFVDDEGQVFEAAYTGNGRYHGYPVPSEWDQARAVVAKW